MLDWTYEDAGRKSSKETYLTELESIYLYFPPSSQLVLANTSWDDGGK